VNRLTPRAELLKEDFYTADVD